MGLPLVVVPTTTASKDPEPCHEVYRGDTIQIPFQVVQRRAETAIDVTGWTFWFTAKYALPQPDREAAIAQDNIVGGNGGVALVAPAMGQGVVTVQPITTRAFPDGPVRMEYDLQCLDLAGVVTTIERGAIVVVPDVTRAITA